MLSSKQRAYLRGLANAITPIFQVGKGGVNANLITQLYEALEARELIKITVLGNSTADARNICDEIVLKTGSEPVAVIGSKIVIYKESREHKTIVLPKI